MTRAATLLLVLLPATLFAGACGGSGSFPEPGECIRPAPIATATPGLPSRAAYFRTIRDGIDRLDRLEEDFRAKYPSGNFSRRQEFRLDFAEYADETRCLATYLRDLPAPGPEFAPVDVELDTKLNELLAFTEAGREAVRMRNVSEWRKWRDGVDAKIEAVRAAYNSRPQN